MGKMRPKESSVDGTLWMAWMSWAEEFFPSYMSMTNNLGYLIVADLSTVSIHLHFSKFSDQRTASIRRY